MTPDAIGTVEMLRLELEVGVARPAGVCVQEDEMLSELDVADVINDKTSIVFVVVTTGSDKEVRGMTGAVMVFETIGAAADTIG